MRKPSKQDNGFTGLGTENEITAAGLATNFMGKAAMPAGFALDMYSANHELNNNIKSAQQTMGEDARTLVAGSPAFKKYLKKELPSIFEERALSFGVSTAVGLATVAAVSFFMGPPGWIMGAVIAIGSGLLASPIKEMIWPSETNNALKFASQLQQMGQQQQLSPEMAFIALSMNMPDKQSKQDILSSIPKRFNITRARDLVKLLNTEEGIAALRTAMIEKDARVRAGVGAMSAAPQMSISEEFATLINSGQMAGVDLLNLEKTGYIGTLLAMRDAQIMQQMQQQQYAATQQQNPNQGLPQEASRAAHLAS